jgi:LacI family transcriptional regulator
VRAVEDHAYHAGYTVLVCNTDETAEKQQAYLETLVDERVVGVVLSPSAPAGPEIPALIDGGIPVVAFDREVADPRADAVIADNVGAARLAVDHLVAAGHRRVTLVSGRRDVETGAERLDGYTLAMRAHGLEPHAVDGDFRIDGAFEAVSELLARGGDPTALLIGNNLMTLGALGALHRHGRRIPEDVAIVAFDEAPWAPFLAPPLTTLAQPVRRMATEAVQLLLERVTGNRTQPRRTVHPFELHVRRSCGTH